MQYSETMDPDGEASNREDGDAELAPLERRRRFTWLFMDRAGEALREGGMLVVVFGLLDYFLGEGKQGAAWPWKCSAVGATLWMMGIALEWGLNERRTRWTEH